ncbi:MAG: HNH endonuclease [Alphaproteobacteria bacterium]
MARGKPWQREETLQAIELYCLTPFGRIHRRNPEIIALARSLDRTPDSIALKMVNFAHLDPTLDQQGMHHVSRLDRELWAEFFENPDAFFAEREVAKTLLPQAHDGLPIGAGFREGGTYEYMTKGRKNQDYFRDMILATYENKCCVTGIAVPELLVASHIVPWARNQKLRTDPRNGLCLNALHDKAFDRGLISLDTDYRLIIGSKLKRFKYPIFNAHEGKKVSLPKRFLPSQDCLDEHRKMHHQTLR